jgi:hypothetical protein
MKSGKARGFIFTSTKTLYEKGVEQGLKPSLFPDLTGKIVIFAGVDAWVYARAMKKYAGPAWINDIPMVMVKVGIPVGDAVYMGRGVWQKRPPQLKKEVALAEVKQTVVKSICVMNAKRLHKLILEEPKALKVQDFRKTLMSHIKRRRAKAKEERDLLRSSKESKGSSV